MGCGSTAYLLAAVAFVVLAVFPPVASGDAATLESVPDLVKAMSINVESFPCVRLLNHSGQIGCSNPGHNKVIALIVRFRNRNDQLVQPSAVLLHLNQMTDFFLRVSNDPELYRKIAGVLVEANGVDNVLELSPDRKFPQQAFAPYSNLSHHWNPTRRAHRLCKRNEKSVNGYPANVAEFDLVMQTTKAGTHDSESCLREQSCLPLGGQSVWTSLPPISNSSTKHHKPIIMVTASHDSASFFRDRSLGADSPISGLIALLTAVDALSHLHDLSNLKKQLVFAVFNGEAWGLSW